MGSHDVGHGDEHCTATQYGDLGCGDDSMGFEEVG